MQNITVDQFTVPRQPHALNDPLAPRLKPSHKLPAIEEEYIRILSSDEALLNDTCINDCAALLYPLYPPPISRRIAILSTYELGRIRRNATDDELWRNTKRTSFWESSIWILPIHRPTAKHWVMCTIDLGTRTLRLFDSLAERHPWERDTRVGDSLQLFHQIKFRCHFQDIIQLVSRLSHIASVKRNGPLVHLGKWTAYPVTVRIIVGPFDCTCLTRFQLSAVQTNAIDCGLWVLAQIIAVLRGFDATNLAQRDMPAFREYIRNLVLHSQERGQWL